MRAMAATFLVGITSAMLLIGCGKEEVDPNASYTVTVGVFLLNNGTYEDQNKDLTFITQEDCQSWSRTAQADTHSTTTHLHYNAAKNTTYDASSETITWVEYGPEISQEDIDATCTAGIDGATKIANKTDYSVDKNFYLQIKSVVEN